MRALERILIFGTISLTACGRPPLPATASVPSSTEAAPRQRPPLITRSCDGLSRDELQDASDYLSQVTRFKTLAPQDATDAVQQRSSSNNPSRIVGVVLYLPAERGMNRAYLERLLHCHAVQPPHVGEHPHDPMLAPGIIAVDVLEGLGGEYQIHIRAETRADVAGIVARATALMRDAASITVEQVE